MGGWCTKSTDNASPAQLKNKFLPADKKNGAPQFSKQQSLGRSKASRQNKVDPKRFIVESDEGKNAQITERQQTRSDIEFIKENWRKDFLFTDLNEQMMDEIVTSMKHHAYEANSVIFKEGDPGQYFYIMISGELTVSVQGELKATLGPGQCFGELALINNSPRTASIQTVQQTQLWALESYVFRKVLTSLNEARHAEDEAFIKAIPIFQLLTDRQRDSLISHLVLHKYQKNENIVVEGEPGDLCYIIKSGSVVATYQGQELRKMDPGYFFGEQVLLYSGFRTATVTTLTNVECFSLSKEDVDSILGSNLQFVLYKNSTIMSLEKSKYLSVLRKDQMEQIAERLNVKTYAENETVIPAKIQWGSGLWIVLKGKLTQNGNLVASKFDCIGDEDIQEGEEYGMQNSCDIVSGEAETGVGFISRRQFEAVIGGNVTNVAQNNKIMQTLAQIELFKSLSRQKLLLLAESLQQKWYDEGQYIIQEGEEGEEFYIVKDGLVNIKKRGIGKDQVDHPLRTLESLAWFGERSLLTKETRSASAVATQGPVTCWTLNAANFKEIMDPNIQNYLIERMALQDDSIQLNELQILRQIGSGMFGCVYLVSHRTKKTLYALKCVSRKKIHMYQIYDNLVDERKITLQLDHSMIMKLVKTFKDSSRIYFLMEYIHGIDMFDAIREMNVVSDSQAQFFIGCLVLALENLGEHNIIHRDLKPENVMVDKEGYAKLIDFGTAKVIKGRTYTIVGTPHYMSSELVSGKGYTIASDLWSLGIMLYEFITCMLPFGENFQDTYKVYGEIMHKPLQFPPSIKANSPLKHIILQMLDRNPSKRGTASELKNHPWFKVIDWELLHYKIVKPQYKPQLKEIKKSAGMGGTLNDIILRDEMAEGLPASSDGRSAPKDWDIDF